MSAKVPTYDSDIEGIKQFFQEFHDDSGGAMHFKYAKQLEEIVNRRREVLEIDLDDLDKHDMLDLKDNILKNCRRYVSLFANAADELAKEITPSADAELGTRTILDTYIDHRQSLLQQHDENADSTSHYPPQLMRRYEVAFIPPKDMKKRSIRQVDAEDIGSLVTMEGIVTRATAVKPLMSVATYSCDACGGEVYQEIKSPNFMPLQQCVSESCSTNKSRGRLTLQTRGSKFVKYQELKIQELSSHVPTGHIPRSMTVHVYGHNTRVAAPGDEVSISGIFLPVPYTGFRAIRAGLLSDTYLEAQVITKKKKSHSEEVISEEEEEEILARAMEGDIFDDLAGSIAPEIYGHDNVKRALLLLLVGGVDRKMKDGMKIRGDINICLMGDPGVAKSQLLKRVSELAPRSVYTTGRGSTGVGLTAAITRDPLTNELILEGGALVMADMGVCCIDEFDKMEDGDRTAIHEVMEQQTISIAKAGITTTLNARSAILAAANPLYGRYDTRRSPTQNINLPAALLSRFDLLFLLVDRPDANLDLNLAKHIVYVHTHNDVEEVDSLLEKKFIRKYIALAKRKMPFVTEDLTEYIADTYTTLRSQEDNVDDTHITARTLLAILRLSTAVARLRMHEQVEKEDFMEATRLMEESKGSLFNSDGFRKKKNVDPSEAIYKMIKEYENQKKKEREEKGKKTTSIKLSMTVIEGRATDQGFTTEQIKNCIDQYKELNVIMEVDGGSAIMFTHGR
eukprot:m.7627 g.7627  ORF g.7627 m.7627 type:complete len:738 (+) comp2874_c0_seq1:60-2273(+)